MGFTPAIIAWPPNLPSWPGTPPGPIGRPSRPGAWTLPTTKSLLSSRPQTEKQGHIGHCYIILCPVEFVPDSQAGYSGAGSSSAPQTSLNSADDITPLGTVRQVESLILAYQEAHDRNESGPDDITMLLNWVNEQSSFESGFSKVVIKSKTSGSIIVTLGSSVWKMDICSPTPIPSNNTSQVSPGTQGNHGVTVDNTESTQMVIDRMLAAFEASGFYNPALHEQNELAHFSGSTGRQAVQQLRNDPGATITNSNKASHHQSMAFLGERAPDDGPSESPEWVIELVNHIFAQLDDSYSAINYWKRPAQETHGSMIHHAVSDPFFPQPSLSAAKKSRVQSGRGSKQDDSSGKSKQSGSFGRSRQTDSSGKSSSDDSAWNKTTLPVTLSRYDDLAGW
ncbi:hypothetical protein V502_08235 [Pseudogymnoascus sp. VKM F-4520 (FW-2644)]|nr:hypothetical protein V502_08235 [Pseudogymnoascus sp. VKM F-4520 (FW-2644)]